MQQTTTTHPTQTRKGSNPAKERADYLTECLEALQYYHVVSCTGLKHALLNMGFDCLDIEQATAKTAPRCQ